MKFHLALLALLFALPAAAKSYVAIPLDDLINSDQPIIVGKITGVRQGRLDGNAYHIATIDIRQTLRGDNLEKAQLIWTDSAMFSYQTGDEGVWFLTPAWLANAEKIQTIYYTANHPSFRQPLDQLPEIERLLARESIRVRLHLNLYHAGPADRRVRVTIHNAGKKPLTLDHPHNRSALTFIVIDDRGNIVKPVGQGKSDPATQTVTIAPRQSAEVYADKLEFVSGTALWGYELEKGKTYRVHVLYRPDAKDPRGIASAERTLTIR